MTTTKVNSEFIAVNAISGTIIADGAITSTHLAVNCVDSSELVTGSIDTIHIAANQVTSTKIVSDAVLTRHIADDQITQALIAVNSVGVSELNLSDGTNGQVLTTDGSGTLSFSTVSGYTDSDVETYLNTSEIYTDATNDRLGIGTTSPTDKLNISSGTNQIGLDTGNQATYGTLDIGHFTNGAFIGTQAGSNAASNTLRFGTSGSERLRIDSSGNLLVGKTAVGVGNAGIELRANNMAAISRASDNVLYLNRITNDGSILEFRQDNVAVGNIGVVSADRMYFATADGLGLQFDKDNNRIVPCDTAGAYNNNVELGDSSLEFTNLWLSGAANIANLKISGSQGTDGQLLTSTGSGIAWEDAPAGGPTFKTFGTSSIMIGSNSTGTINAADYNTAVSTTAFAALTTGDFNVAFGEQALDALTTGGGNTALGVSTLGALTTANNNTAVGISALTSNTDGTVNTAVGSDSMAANTTGSYNVAVGSLSLDANTTASNNTAVGYAAGTSITTGQENTLIGGAAGDSITTGTRSVALGYAALSGLTTPSYHVAIGYNSGASCVTGLENVSVGSNTLVFNTASYNTAIGTNALYASTTGSYNTSVGKGALDSNTTASFNTATGYNSLGVNTTGEKNVAFGASAGESCTTGSRNVFVGESAGFDATDATNNVFVGFETQNDNAGTSSQVVIGHKARSQGGGFFTVGNSSTIYTYVDIGSTSWQSSSDERLKKEITNSTAGLSFINDLRPVTFKWKTKGEVDSNLPHYEEGSNETVIGASDLSSLTKHGFVAQEVKTVLDNHPEVKEGAEIWKENNEGIQHFSPSALIPMLVKALQEADNKIDALTTRIEALEG